jgi:RNA polymerase sigma factor (sigma-70 family)
MKNMKANSISVSYRESEAGGIEIMGCEAGKLHESTGGVTANEIVELPDPRGVEQWSDAQLITSVRCEPPNEAALAVLVNRYWNTVFARCQMLTQDYDKAHDLAQATWCRLLRARQGLKPDGNFPAYLAMISTNLFRDSYRASRRAGPMADYRLESLEGSQANHEGETVVLVDIVADLKSLQTLEQTVLAMDIDEALQQLSPQLREVIIARFIDGESCAEIGLRHRRTEQTVSGWVREALRQMKCHLEGREDAADQKEKNWETENARLAVGFPSLAAI